MDRYSIFAPNSMPGPQPVPDRVEETKAPVPEPLRFPGDDGGRSLSEMAQRDLTAALQLLTERAQYITGASGAAIALRDASEMICRASAGSSAPELGAHLQVDSGLSGESVRTKQILRCDDAETDPRVNRESCRALGIASVMVMPLIREEEVTGVFELFSERVNAFEERDIVALQRIAEMIQTAVEHAEAAERAEKEIAGDGAELQVAVEAESKKEASVQPAETATGPEEPAKPAAPPEVAEAVATPVVLNIHKCTKCGFPVSEGRALCLDCEAAQAKDPKPAAVPATAETANYVPQFGSGEVAEESWLRSHVYLVGVLLVVAIVVGVLLRFH
jgi:putative methionine-R-sulfoxide reductase with GAF domain